MTFDDLYHAVKEEGGFDESSSNISEAKIKEWINDRYRELVARAYWRKAEITLGTTVSNQAEYALPDDVVDLAALRLDTTPYERVGQRTLWDLKVGYVYLRGEGGVFAPDFTQAGVAQIEIYPAPTADGTTIYGFAALEPSTLANDGDVPIVPVDFHPAIVDGAIALGLARIDEHLPEADRYEARFEQKVEELRRRQNSRIGSGPSRIRVVA